MIALILSIVTSVLVGQLLRASSYLKLDRFPLFSVNYTVALALGLVLSEGSPAKEPAAGIALAAFLGVTFVLGFLVFHRAIAVSGTGIAATVSRLSVILPIVVSVLAFSERIGPAGVAGVMVGVAALPFSGPRAPFAARTGATRHWSASGLFWALALFLIFGTNDAALKIRAELLPDSDAGSFFAILFGTALLVTLVIVVIRRERFVWSTLFLGIPLGAVNYGTSYFLASALGALPGYVAFTLNSVGIILLAAVIGRVVWQERIRAHNLVFFAASVAAIVLLSWVGARQ